jgi:hypothetical protein
MRTTRFVLSALAFTLCLTPLAFAQIPPRSDTTSTPLPGTGHDYLQGPVDTLSPQNGSLSIRIPVIMPPGRGVTLSFNFVYNSSGALYLGTSSVGLPAWKGGNSLVSSAGWTDGYPVLSVSEINWNTLDINDRTVKCYALVNYIFQDASGTTHNLNLTTYSDAVDQTNYCTTNTWDWPAGFSGAVATQGGEGSVLATMPLSNALAPVTVTDADGTVYSFPYHTNPGTNSSVTYLPTSVTDRNGNTITISSTGTYTDTLGRTALTDSAFLGNPETVTVAGLGAPYTLSRTTLGQTTFTIGIQTIFGTCNQPAHPGAGGVSNIALPNGKSYSIAYDAAYGLPNKITYPTGGYVRFVWGLSPLAQYGTYIYQGATACSMHYDVPAVVDRYVSFDGSAEVLHQHFVYSTTWTPQTSTTWASKQTTITTTDLLRNTSFNTVYTYSPIGADVQPNTNGDITSQIPVEQSIAYYDTNGALLKTVTKTWGNERLLMSQETSYPNGLATETTWSYNSSEMQIEQDDYDFGTTAPPNPPGPLLRATVTSYSTFGTNYIVDKPSSVIIYSDAAKTNKVAETDYTYDNPVGTTTSGIVQHSAGCNCGNLTKTANWLTSTGTTLSTNFTNDDTGSACP